MMGQGKAHCPLRMAMQIWLEWFGSSNENGWLGVGYLGLVYKGARRLVIYEDDGGGWRIYTDRGSEVGELTTGTCRGLFRDTLLLDLEYIFISARESKCLGSFA